jgi:hypothetical protein
MGWVKRITYNIKRITSSYAQRPTSLKLNAVAGLVYVFEKLGALIVG